MENYGSHPNSSIMDTILNNNIGENFELDKLLMSNSPIIKTIDMNDSKFPEEILPIDMQFNAGHVVSISVYGVLFILSALGNLTVLIAILRRKRKRHFLSRIDLLLVHLAIADLIVTFFMMPLEIGWAATVEWKAGDELCRLMAFFRIFGLYLSGFVLVCLAMDRYLAVRHPLKGIASTKRAKWMVSIAWIPQVFIFHVERHPIYTWYTQCVTYNFFPTPQYEFLYNIFVMFMMYTIPLILLVALYGSIAVQMWKVAHSAKTTFGTTDGPRSTGLDNIERARIKSIQMTFVITAAFLICWTPYYFMCVWYWVDPVSAKTVDQRVQKGLFLFASTNSAVNPIVYGIFHMKSIFGKDYILSQPRESSLNTHNRILTRHLDCNKVRILYMAYSRSSSSRRFTLLQHRSIESTALPERSTGKNGAKGESIILQVTKSKIRNDIII